MKNIIRQYFLVCEICQKAKYERHPYKIMFAETPIPKKTYGHSSYGHFYLST